MSVRTTSTAVQRVLGGHYDAAGQPALDAFIKTAAILTDQVAAQTSAPTASELAEIECYLSAHFYAHADQITQSRNTGGASGQFMGQTAMVLTGTQYGQTAMLLDWTGYLAKRSKEVETGQRRVASGIWLGLPPSEQLDFEDRD
jgi:hypothetical protein